MNCPFALIIPGYPMITEFQQVDNTKFVTVLPNPSQITEICFSVSPNLNIPAGGLAIYYSFNEQDGWSILGTVTPNLPSGFFRTGWGTMNVENYPCVQIGISIESGDFVNNLQDVIQTPVERELPILKVAKDLFNYITSFSTSNNSITIPLNFMDRWLEKTKKKLEKDPNYFYKYACLFQNNPFIHPFYFSLNAFSSWLLALLVLPTLSPSSPFPSSPSFSTSSPAYELTSLPSLLSSDASVPST